MKEHGHDYNCWMHLTALDLIALTGKKKRKKIMWMKNVVKEEFPNASEMLNVLQAQIITFMSVIKIS